MTAALELIGVAAGYGAHRVLGGLNLSVAQGEWVAVLGPNGSGKTTLLRTLSNFLPPQAGAVWVEGQPLALLPDRERALRLGLVGAEPAPPVPLTVAEYVALGRIPHGRRLWEWQSAQDRAAVERALAAAGLQGLAQRPVTTLSSGEFQRVVLARALAQEPRILLLDEPTSHLDIRHQVEIMELLDHLRRTWPLTLVATLHDINLAALFCDRLVLLHDGRVLAAGTPAAVLRPEVLQRAYGCRVLVQPHPVYGLPQVVLVPSRARHDPGPGDAGDAPAGHGQGARQGESASCR